MKTFTKHILLLALMLFGVAGAAWAQTVFTTLQVGDVIHVGDQINPGVKSRIDFNGWDYICSPGQNTPWTLVRANLGPYGPGEEANVTESETGDYYVFKNGNNYYFTEETRISTTENSDGLVVTSLTPGNIPTATVAVHEFDPTVPALDELTGNWNFLMPGANKVVKVTYKAEPALAWTYGNRAIPNDTTITAYRGFELPVIGNIGAIMNHDFHTALVGGTVSLRYGSTNPAVISFTNPNNMYSFSVNGAGECDVYMVFDGNDDFQDDSVAFHAVIANPATLTLQPNDYNMGTLEIAESIGTVYTFTFEQSGISGDSRAITIPANRFPYDTTFSYNANITFAYAYDQMGEGVSIFAQGDNWITVRISGPFEYGGYYQCDLDGGASDNWTISCTTGTGPVPPDGVIAGTAENTYRVLPGTTVNVTATPDSAHYLSAIGNEAVISNSAYNYSFTMPGDDTELAATFTTKPTLTLAQTAGGTLEAIVPQGAGEETLLTTVTATGHTSYSQSSDGIVTVTLNNIDSYHYIYGWLGGGSVTVEAAQGYTITRCLFKQGDKTPPVDNQAPFTATIVGGDIDGGLPYVSVETSTGPVNRGDMNGITSIEVYGYQNVAANVIASSTPNTYIIDYGTPVTVKATPDAQHYLVSFSDDAPATERNSNIAVEKTYDSVIADIPNLSANFQAKPTLTLTANDGGTLTLDGMTYDTVYTINFGGERHVVPANEMPYTIGYSWCCGYEASGHELINGNDKVEFINQGTTWVNIRVKGAFEGSVTYGCNLEYEEEPYGDFERAITCTASTVPVLPAGVVSANATLDTFVVDYGTTLTVTATPDSAHYLKNFSGFADTNSNTAVAQTYTITENTTATANFELKPTLTLAHNDGGEMEIVPEEVLAANEFTVPSSWSEDYSHLVAPTDLPSDFQSVTEAEACAWQNTTGHPVYLFFKALGSGSAAACVRFNADGTVAEVSTNTKGTIYNNVIVAGSLVRYTTVGAASNFIASTTEPNTYYIDYNTSVTVKATPSDTAYLVRFDQDDDTNSNTAVEKTYGPLTAALTTAEATFNDKPVLTLAANDTTWGKVMLEGAGSSSETIAQFLASEVNNDVWHEITGTVSNITDTTYGDFDLTDNTASVYVYGLLTPDMQSRQFGSMGIVEGTNITIMAHRGEYNSNPQANGAYLVSINPTLPAGVAQLTDSTYRVDYGTTLTLQADATTLHHVANWEDQNGDTLQTATYSAYFVTDPVALFPDSSSLTFTMTTDTVARAMFYLNYYKLTFAHNEGGTMEFVIPQDSLSFLGITNKNVSRGSISIEADSADADGMFVKSGMSDIDIVIADASITQVDFHVTNGTNLVSNYLSVAGCPECVITTTTNNEYGSIKGLDTNHVTIKSSVVYDLQIDQFTVHYGRALPEGAIYGPDSNSYYILPDSTVTVRAIPADGHYLVRWSDNATVIDTLSASITMGKDDTLTATFAPNPVITLAVNDPAMGSVYFTGYHGNTITRAGIIKAESIALPYNWYEASDILEIQGGEGKVTKDATGHYLTVSGIFDTIATVVTSTGAFNVTCEPTLPNGVRYNVAKRSYTVMPYTDLSLTATPAADHYFVDWAQVRQTDSIPDSAIVSTQAVHSFRIDGDMKLQGNFLHNPYVLTVKADSVMGSVEADTAVVFARALTDTTYSVMADSTVTLVANALTGYHITGWQNAQSTQNIPSNPNDLITDTVLVKMTKDSTVTISFDTNVYNVMLTVQNDERTSQAMGTVTGADSVKHFLTDTLTVEAAYGYTFKGWYDADTNLVSELDTLVISPVSDTALMALFTVNEYAILGQALDTAAGYVKGSDSVAYLDTVVLRAYANTGYHFVNWQDTTGLQLGAADTLQIIVEGDSTVYAVFDTNHYNLVVKVDSASTGFGTVTGSDSVARHFVDYVINATADSGYHFVRWSNGSTKAIDTVSLVSDSTIAAIFDTNVYKMNVVVADSCTGFGTVTGDSLAKHFLSYDISATANPGFHFVMWSDSVTDAVRTVELTSDTTIAAIFDYNPSLTLDYREARGDVQFIVESDTVRFQGITDDTLRTGIVSVMADSADAMGISLKNGKTMTIATDGSAVITQVAFHLTNGTNKAQLITADAGTVNATTGNAYGTVVNIRRDTVVISSTSDKDINIDQLTIQYASELPDGVVRLESDNPNVYRVDYHTTVNLLAVPNDDSYLINWAGDTVRTAGLTAEVTVDSADVTVTANFSGNPVVTLIANGHGRVYFDNYGGYTVNRNEEVRVTNFTEFPHTWYETGAIDDIIGGDGMVTKDSATSHYVSVHGAFNGTATVVTSSGSFTVTCIPTVPNGVEVMSLDTYTMEPGTVITVKGEPESEEYYLASWSDTAMADSVRSVTVTRDTALVANFLHFPYVLTLKADTVRGAASVVDSQAYVSVLTDSTYSVMADSVVALSVAPNASYHFVSWMEADSVYSTKADTSVVAGSDRTLTATFDTNVYEVLIAVAEADSIKGFVTNTPDSVKHYLSATYYATPDTGYHFTSWVNAAGTVVSSKDTLVVSPVSDTALYATFDTNVYVLTVLAADTAQGSVTGSDSTAKHFVEYEISATAANCYYFTKWSDGDSTNPRMVTLTSDSVITAQFAYIPRVGYDTIEWCDSVMWNDSVYCLSGDYEKVLQTTGGCDSTAKLHLTIKKSTSSVTTVTNCESYTWHDITYTMSTLAHFDTINAVGCDSIANLDLTIHYNSVSDTTVVTCDSVYRWNGITYVTSTIGTWSTTDVNGCDSTATLYLTLNNVFTGIDEQQACESFTWIDDSTYTESQLDSTVTYTFVGGAANGCDSTVTLLLTISNNLTTTEVQTACESYTWVDGVTYTESTDTPTYVYHLSSGCDSTVTLDLTVTHSVTNAIVDSTCSYYIWDGTYYNESGVYSKSYPAANGCDSVVTLTLTVNQPVTTSLTETACDSYLWNGIEYAASGAYTQHFTGSNGCDSTVNLTLTVKQSKSATVVASGCDSYEWHGKTYTATPAVAPTYTTVGSNGCDSVTTLQLTVKKSTTGVETVEACDSYEWHGTVYTASNNTATYHTTNAAGCDSTVTLHLTIKKGVTYSFADTACQSYIWDGNYYNQSGSYSKHYTAANGCDSTATLNLTISQAVTESISATACGSYTWNEVNYATSGVYKQTLDGSNGCDSIVTLTLTVNQPTTATVVASACDSYEWHGETYTETPAVAPTYTTEGANGCDSVTTLQLVIVHSGTSVDTVEACDSYTWIDGVTYTASTNEPTYTITGDACNVEVTLNLTIKHSVEYSFNDTACQSYIWDGTYYNESGSYSQSYTAANGCDSTATLTLVINQQVTSDINESVCGSYTWNEQTYTASGVYSQTFAGSNGCDSVVTLTLIVKQPVAVTVMASACDSYEWNGAIYTESGVYTDTTTGSNGCDSVTTLQLTVRQSTSGVETVEACDSYEWHGTVYTASNNTATYHTNNVAGCDSTVTLNLTIKQSVENSFDAAACTYYIWGGTYYSESGVYSKTYVAANGCDSVVTLTLTVNQPVTTGLTETACGSYTWNGIEYAASGAYSQSFTGVNGCDSTVTLTLTVKQPKTATVSASACGSYTWNGSVYTASGSYSYTTEGSNGCDSTVTLQLTINNPVHMAETEMACGSYSWHGSVYTTSGDYTYSHLDNNGCTQVDTLHLTIHTPVHTAETEVACSSYIWNGSVYTTSGNYYYSHIDNNGCTQVDTLHLTIHQPVTVSVSEMACGSYAWNGSVYTASGSYSYTTEGSNGCDSTVILQLTINNPVHTAETKVACGSYTWNGSVYSESGDYTYSHLDNNGCTQVDTLHLTIGNSVNEDETVINCDSYEWNGRMYTESGDYSYSTTTVAGCDSTVTLHLTINHSAESSFDTLSTGSFVWNGETFTESGTYVRTLTTVTGCDSVVTMNLVILPEGFVMPYLYNLMDVMLSVNHNEEGMENVNYVWYRWYRDGEMVLEGPDHDSYSEGGNRLNGCYYVEVAVDGNMEYWVRSNTVCIGNVGIGDVEEIEFTVAPNPVMHGSMVKVSVEGTDLQGAEIRVYDLQGRMVLQQKDNDVIEAPQASGMYMVRLTLNDGRSAVKRLIVK